MGRGGWGLHHARVVPGEDDEARAVGLGFAARERLEGPGAGEGRGVRA